MPTYSDGKLSTDTILERLVDSSTEQTWLNRRIFVVSLAILLISLATLAVSMTALMLR